MRISTLALSCSLILCAACGLRSVSARSMSDSIDSTPLALGDCVLTCEGNVLDTKIGVSQSACTDEIFEAIPRCAYSIDWKQAEPQGSCALICEGNLLDTKTGVTQKECLDNPYDVFEAIPRCAYSTEWTAQ